MAVDYGIYGTPIVLQQPPFAFDQLFAGQVFDAQTGLYAFKIRFYDPSIGRFIMFDPAMEVPSPYCYVLNNPTLWTDPSGMSASTWGIVVGAVLVAGGVVLTLATMGSAAPLLITGSIVGAAALGAGISSISYSATHKGDDWHTSQWLLGMAVGGISGAASAGVGLAVGAGANLAASTITGGLERAAGSFAKQAAAKIATSIVAGSVTGGISNAAGTLTANWLTHSNLGDGLVTSLVSGMAFGAVGGFFGGVAGLRSSVARQYRPTEQSIANWNEQPINARDKFAATGIVDAANDRVFMEDLASLGRAEDPYGVAHAQQALGENLIIRDDPGVPVAKNMSDQWEASGHALQGFSLQYKSGSNSTSINFNSTFLNGARNSQLRISGATVHGVQMPQLDRACLMSSLRYDPQLRLRLTLSAPLTTLDKVVAGFTRLSL